MIQIRFKRQTRPDETCQSVPVALSQLSRETFQAVDQQNVKNVCSNYVLT
jgi:hypothetical protein